MTNPPLKVVKNFPKQLPCNIEAEQAVIGSILVLNDIYDEVSLIIDSNKFFDPIHVKIYSVIEKLIAKGLLANPITLKNYFENDEGLKELGGQEYLIKITKFSTSVKQAADYANIVHEMHLRRELIKVSDTLLNDSSNENESLTKVWCAKEVLFKIHGNPLINFKKNLFIEKNNDEIIGRCNHDDISFTTNLSLIKNEKFLLVYNTNYQEKSTND